MKPVTGECIYGDDACQGTGWGLSDRHGFENERKLNDD